MDSENQGAGPGSSDPDAAAGDSSRFPPAPPPPDPVSNPPLAAHPVEPGGDEPLRPAGNGFPPPDALEPPLLGDAPAPAEPPEPFAPEALGAPRFVYRNALPIWLIGLLLFGVGGLIAGQQELAIMVAIAGVFVAAQAADIDPRWTGFYYLLTWTIPIGGAAAFFGIGALLWKSEITGTLRALVTGLSVGSGLASLATGPRPGAHALASVFFRTEQTSHTLRLSARIALLCLLLAIPGWFAFRGLFDNLIEQGQPLLERASLESGLVGYVILAFAAVGFMIRRDLRATLDRLGLKPLTTSHFAIAAIGIVALYGLNAGADWAQKTMFPGLWESDHKMNEAIATGLGIRGTIWVGLSAGIGEEITMRGALQPKLGLVLTSLLFAALHVQYSWFGMGVIFLLGLVLGTIRRQTSTTTAMLVHVTYDILALFTV